MQTKNKILMQQAKASLKGKWWSAVGVFFIYMLIICGANSIPKIGSLIQLAITGPFMLGMSMFVLNIANKKEASISQIFDGFKTFWKSVGTYLLMVLFVMLWSLLLIIPGIIAGFAYSMTFYILAENKNIKPLDALKESKKLMRGNKWKLFCLSWRFFGWALLCILTAGIGFFWLLPYMNVSFAKFYEDIKKNSGKTDGKAKEGEVIIEETITEIEVK
jgi:uncharacterized membrane protein